VDWGKEEVHEKREGKREKGNKASNAKGMQEIASRLYSRFLRIFFYFFAWELNAKPYSADL